MYVVDSYITVVVSSSSANVKAHIIDISTAMKFILNL